MELLTAKHLKLMIGLLYDTTKYSNFDLFADVVYRRLRDDRFFLCIELQSLERMKDENDFTTSNPDSSKIVKRLMESNEEVASTFIQTLFRTKYKDLPVDDMDIKELNLTLIPKLVLEMDMKTVVHSLNQNISKKMKESQAIRDMLMGDGDEKKKKKKKARKEKKQTPKTLEKVLSNDEVVK